MLPLKEAQISMFRLKKYINAVYISNTILFATVQIIYKNNDVFVLIHYTRGSGKQTCSVPVMRFNLYIDETNTSPMYLLLLL